MLQQENRVESRSKVPESWRKPLAEELAKPYLRQLADFVDTERQHGPVYPPAELTFNALIQTPYENVKVVIVGQDPYHGPGQAHGLSFSVMPGVTVPPSLRNIYKEIEQDLGFPPPAHGCLLSWAQQGVLLLNTTLTVRSGEPRSHFGKGWEQFTDSIIAALIRRPEPLVFLLWGQSAKEKVQHFHTGQQHLVLTAAHPSPYSATNFFGCRHFSKANAFLEQHGQIPINWQL